MTEVKFLAYCENGKFQLVPGVDISQAKLLLPEVGQYEIAIDQSTKCTGLYIRNQELKLHVVMEVLRSTNLDRYNYIIVLRRYLAQLFEGRKVSYLIHELPVKGKGFKSSSILTELVGIIKSWQAEEEFLKGAIVDGIYPQSWKTHVLDKSKGKNRHRDKNCTKEDLIDKLPWLEKYGHSIGDSDAYDAVGILIGYMSKHFTTDGVRRIAGSSVSFDIRCFPFFIYEGEDVKNSGLNDFFIFPNSSPQYKEFNNELSLWENIRRCLTSAGDISGVYTRLNDTSMILNMMWESNIPADIAHKVREVWLVMYSNRSAKFIFGDYVAKKENFIIYT